MYVQSEDDLITVKQLLKNLNQNLYYDFDDTLFKLIACTQHNDIISDCSKNRIASYILARLHKECTCTSEEMCNDCTIENHLKNIKEI